MNETLRRALFNNEPHTVIKLLEEGEEPNQKHKDKSLLFWVISFNLVTVFDYLVEKQKVTLQETFNDQSCLDYAISCNAKDIALKLMSADVNVQNNRGETPLHLLMEKYDNAYTQDFTNEEIQAFTLFLKKIFALHPDLSLVDNNGISVMEKIKSNDLALSGYNEYELDRKACIESIKAYLMVPQSKTPWDLKKSILCHLPPSYVPASEKEKYIAQIISKGKDEVKNNKSNLSPSVKKI